MKAVIRVDGSHAIGTGHVMRCLTLAHAMKKQHIESTFISRLLPDHMCDFVEAEGFNVARLPAPKGPIANPLDEYAEWLGVSWEEDAHESRAVLNGSVDCLIVDHYGLDKRWHMLLRPETGKILVIDDLANRPLHCEFVLNQNLMRNPQKAYLGLVPNGCECLMGPRFALLREEFLHHRRQDLSGRSHGNKVVVFLGGADSKNVTELAVRALMSLPNESVDATIVVGAANHNKKALESLCEGADNLALVTEVSNMAELFAQADLAIGAGGTTTWERCAVGLPSILVTLAENQRSNCERAQELGAALHLGAAETLTQAAMSAAIEQLLNDTELWKQMSENAAQLVDGQGSQRVIEAILKDS